MLCPVLLSRSFANCLFTFLIVAQHMISLMHLHGWAGVEPRNLPVNAVWAFCAVHGILTGSFYALFLLSLAFLVYCNTLDTLQHLHNLFFCSVLKTSDQIYILKISLHPSIFYSQTLLFLLQFSPSQAWQDSLSQAFYFSSPHPNPFHTFKMSPQVWAHLALLKFVVNNLLPWNITVQEINHHKQQHSF